MTYETIVWGVVMILLGIIDLLLFFIYLLLRERQCRNGAEYRCGCPDDGDPVPEE